MRNQTDIPAVLTIAGSDSGGGAGLQADLKVFHALGCFGTTAVSCITAQNPDQVRGVEAVSAAMVAEQVRTVCDGFPIAAAKTGMLFSAEIIEAVAGVVEECGIKNLVVDPVMVSTSEVRLLREDAVEALQKLLIPKARVITPNLPEAEVLLGHAIESLEDLKLAAEEIGEKFGVACALKGGHLGEGRERSEVRGQRSEISVLGSVGDEPLVDTDEHGLTQGDSFVFDVLWCDGVLDVFSVPRVDVGETHGTGCTFAAVVTAELAKGAVIRDAVKSAQTFVAKALSMAPQVGRHTPLGVFPH